MLRTKLDELGQSKCGYCWALVHEITKEGLDLPRLTSEEKEEKAAHSLWQCPRLQQTNIEEMDRIRREIRYSREIRTCMKCGIIDYLCGKESNRGESSRRQQSCLWPNVIVPVLYGLRAVTESLSLAENNQNSTASTRSRTTLGRVGYREQNSSLSEFGKWIGQQCLDRRVLGYRVGNGGAAVIAAILEDEE